ncbi:MAG: response regulator [Promethearchaeota archaeon]
MKIEKIFIVDDEPSLQIFYEQVLFIGDFEVAGIANNGIEAVSMFKSFSNKPKVILMDQRMPEMNGIEASKLILQIDNRVKIIFISADSSVKEEAISIGAFLFIDKIFTIDELIGAINRAIKSYAFLTKN